MKNEKFSEGEILTMNREQAKQFAQQELAKVRLGLANTMFANAMNPTKTNENQRKPTKRDCRK